MRNLKMSKINIFSGFLGAGKTTLIKKLIKEAYVGEKVVIIENEFGEIGIDSGFLQDAGIEITEMNSGCICCSLVGDFGKALNKVFEEYNPDRIIIEPSGVGKLSDVIKAVLDLDSEKLELESSVTVTDANRCKMYIKNFGEFYKNQVENADTIILSQTDSTSEEKLSECLKLIRQCNDHAEIITTPWTQLDGKQIVDTMLKKETLQKELHDLTHEHKHCCHGNHEHEDEHHCDCEHHHEHHEHDCCHHHDYEHEHDHHDHECSCGCHHDHNHDHHHKHHHADEVFESWGAEVTAKYDTEFIKTALKKLDNADEYGTILRAKGIISSQDSEWIHFDYIPNNIDVRLGSASTIGRICVIGSNINKEKLSELFCAK